MKINGLKRLVRLCGIMCCLLLPLNCSDSSSPNPEPVSPYAVAAEKAYDQLLEMWLNQESDWNAMWYRGNALDTLIDYVVTANDADRGRELGKDIPWVWAGGVDGNWFDDFGWWGIAFINAARHYQLLGMESPDFFINDGARPALVNMAFAPLVWDFAYTQIETCPQWAQYKPRFDNGIWNCYFGSDECPSENTPNCDPSSTGLCPIQNTVTNGLYLVLTIRYYNEEAESDYWEAAEKEYGFMKNWLSLPDIPEQCEGSPDVLPSLMDSNTGLVRERVGTYAKYDGCYHRVNGYDETVAWSGDQGIVLGATVDLMNTPEIPDEDKNGFLYETALSILSGVETTLTSKQGEKDLLPEGVLRPWTNFNGWDSFPLDPWNDYRTGPGVFMRYLLYAYENSASLREYITSSQSGYMTFLRDNAAAMLDGSYDCDCGGPNWEGKWNTCHLACQTNRLATLIAAMVILE